MSELNAHTYVYQPDKSLQGFTIEVKFSSKETSNNDVSFQALPEADHYEPKQPPLPTLDELMIGKVRLF